MSQGKFGEKGRGGRSARATVLYILGEELGQKVEHAQRNDPLQQSQKTDISALFAEARARDDLGVGVVWSPVAGGGLRPSSIYCRGVWSLETSMYDIEGIARTQPRVKNQVEHIIISLPAAESNLSDEILIRRTEEALASIGLDAGHQAVATVHRDTDNPHVHWAIASVNRHTLKAWNRQDNWFRLHKALREMELKYGMQVEHGLATVRDFDLPTQRIEKATKAERLAWAQERGLAAERLEDRARSFIADQDGIELPEDRRERIVTNLRKMLDGVEDRGEMPLRADVHVIAASLAATIEDGPAGVLRLRMMERAEKGTVARESIDSLGDTVQRMAKWTPSDIVFDVPLKELAPDATGSGPFAEMKQVQAEARRRWLTELGDVARSENEVEEVLNQDPGRPSRDIVASGQALFSAEDIDRWTCSRLSVDGPEWSDRLLREDKTLVVRSVDSEHPLFTTRKQLDLEEQVAALASKLTQERNPLFDRAKLDRAIADVEAVETRAKGKPFKLSDEQRGLLELLEYRFGTTNGVAGSGKTTVMAVVHRYCELTDQPDIGLATAQFAAENLQKKSGIEGVNSTRGLVQEGSRGKELVAKNAVVIVDEFSMTSLEDAKEILERIDARPNACVQYLGGGAQLENILAGNTHRVLSEAAEQHGHHRELTEVFRQNIGSDVEWMRTVMPALDKAILDADRTAAKHGFREFDQHGHIAYHEDRKSEIAGKADDIVRGFERGLRVIAPGCERIEVKYVNRAVRERLGHVGKGILYQLEHRKREFSPDDRIVFTKNAEAKLGVLNGYAGTVLAVTPQNIRVKLDGGRTVDVDPAKYPHLEWGYAVVTHKAQGADGTLVVSSITKSDTARSAYVALTRCTDELRVHTRMKREGKAAPEKRHEELLEHIASDASLRAKDDALLFEQTVNRTGGPDTPWAKAVRRAQEQDADPLRQQHRAEMNERFVARGYAVTELLKKTSEQRIRAERIPDEPKREKRFAAIAAGQRRDMDRIDDKFALESFVSWSVRKRKEVERAAPFLERHAEHEARRQAQRAAHDIAKAPGISLVEQSRAEALRLDEQIRDDKIEAAQAAQRTLHARNLTIAMAACVPIAGTKAAEYLAGRGLRVGNVAQFSTNWPEGVANDAGKIARGFGPAVVFDFRTPAGEVVAAQGRYLDPPVFDGKPFKVWTVGALGESVFWTPDARESGLVTITEAPIDALSVYVATGVPAIALGGTQNRPTFLTEVLAGRKVVLALDNDAPGIAATAKLETLLQRSEMTRLTMPPGIRGATIKDVSEALQSVPDALRYAVQAATTRLGIQRDMEQPRRRGISDDDLAAAIERARERKAQETVDIALVQRIRHELRGLGVRDDNLPSREDILAQLPELRKATAQRNDFSGSYQTEAERIARTLHERGRGTERGYGMS